MIKSKIMCIVLAVVIFVVGLCCGLFLGRLIPSYRMRPRISRDYKHHEEKISNRLSRRFSEKLDLTEEQKRKLSQILDKYKIEMEKLRKDAGPKFKELRNSMKEEIKTILNDQQKDKFIKMTEREKEREQRFESEFGKRKRFKGE